MYIIYIYISLSLSVYVCVCVRACVYVRAERWIIHRDPHLLTPQMQWNKNSQAPPFSQQNRKGPPYLNTLQSQIDKTGKQASLNPEP